MRSALLTALVGGALAVAGCHAEAPRQAAAPPAQVPPPNPLRGIWQLNYYPDSLLLKKDIYQYSNWTTPYAATLRFVADSCELIGWHESGWEKVTHVAEGLYWVGSGDRYQEIQLEPDRLLFREVSVNDSGATTASEWYPYHRVPAVLTQATLAQRLAREVFAGRYRALASDVPADSVVTLGPGFGVRGLRGVARYGVVTDMDWDFLLPNSFSWYGRRGKEVGHYSFEFAGDTLLLNSFEMRPDDDSVPSGIVVTEPVARFLKLPGGPAPVAAAKQ